MLYIFAKMKFVSKEDTNRLYIRKALDVILSEPVLPHGLACRNLWNLYALDYFDEAVLTKLSDVVQHTKPEKLSEIDIAHTLRALAHF